MPDNPDFSLGDGVTHGPHGHRRDTGASLGDERTRGDAVGGPDAVLDDLEIVDLPARYRIEGTLGQGGMGAVVLATDTRLDRKVAIKRILGEAAGNRLAVARFLTEAKAIAALNHPNIVQIYDYGRAKDGPFLIMEYVDGGSLADRCRQGPLPLDDAVDLACRLCDGLAKAHDAGIIHRDIKPANVLLTKDGTPKLTDFGLAKAESGDHGQTMTGAVLGTPDFMPPEQRRDASEVDQRSDLWSLAATFYQMLTGRSPKIVRLHETPQALQAVLGKALEDEKVDRYQSAVVLRDAIRTALLKPDRRQAATAAEFESGECPRCHEQNESHRKFCRNPDCASSLRVPCLSETCGLEMPVWDKVCPECGAKQPELMAAKAIRLNEGKETAERDLANYDFPAAAAFSESLVQITDTRFADYQEWGRAFGARVSTAKSDADELVAARTGEALSHEAAYDYAAAIQALESLPHKQLVGHVAAHLQELRERLGESTQLVRTIKTRIANGELDGLLSLAGRAVELLGDRADLRTLVARLEKRESRLRDQICTAFADARRLFEAGDAKSAMAHMAPFRTGLAPEQMQFKELVQRAVEEEEKLLKLLASAKADGTITPDEVVVLAEQVVQCLKLNPNHPRIHALRQQLVNRIDKTPTDFAEKAEALMSLVASLGGVSAVPDNFRRMLDESELWKSREQLKEYARMRSGFALVRCPICHVELKASNVVLHYDRQHAKR